ncbi:hypothetical protein B5K06_33485 [Rhizobium grahamii]|uniref:Uncharacterized protein n=1 Tax=Rhizobium grahamii TaxID=1120045 RepID=A0A370KE27_9HYPH|nr:hypothetical protein [Rhizobium grahamii]RDJ01478.1 hypothetical protein B5K06_33485 [Rhizobium grahamii]
MASPWKFLVGLVSPEREQRRENSSTENATQGCPSETADPTEAPVEESLNSGEGPRSDAAHRHEQTATIVTERVHSEKVENDGQVDGEDAEVAQVADPAPPGETGTTIIAAHCALHIQGAVEVAQRKQRGRGNKAIAVPNAPHVNDTTNEVSLDKEINLLRSQLATKLMLQNAQLRQMLERFEG